MKANGKTVHEILINLPEDRVEPFNKLHEVIIKNLPKGFEPGISYGGLGYVIPHTMYPAGYHCKPEEPLPFAGIASQKDSINFYHMGMYADPEQRSQGGSAPLPLSEDLARILPEGGGWG